MGYRTPRRGRRRRLTHTFVAIALAMAVAVPAYANLVSRPGQAHSTVRAPFPPPRAPSQPRVAEDQQSGNFSLLTYNVAGLPGWVSPLLPGQDMPLIAERLNAYDLVLVQEDFSHHAALEQGTTHRYQSVPQTTASRLVNDGLNRFSRFDFVPLTRQRWQHCHGLWDAANDCLAAKGFSVAETSLASGVQLHVYNHHADAGSAPADREARAAQFEQLASYILDYSRGEAILLVGDTNLDPASPDDAEILARFLERTGLLDACDAQLCDAPQLDRILYRGSPQLSLQARQWALPSEFGRELPGLSDHHAVHVRVQWEVRDRANDASAVLRD